MGETLSIKKTWVSLNLRRSFNFHTSAIFEHLATHLCHSPFTVLLEFDERCDDIVLKFADDLLGWKTNGIDIVQVSEQIQYHVLVCWCFHSVVEVTLFALSVVLDILLEEEWITGAHHCTTIVLVLAFGHATFVAAGRAWVIWVIAVLVLVSLVLVFVTKTAHPLGTIFFIFLLEDFDLDSGQGNLSLASLTSDDFLDCDSLVDSVEQLNVLINVNVGAPTVSDSEEQLLEEC